LGKDLTGWGVYSSSLSNYAQSFIGLTTEQELYNHVLYQRALHGKFTALDLMGSGVALEELSPDMVVGTILEKYALDQSPKDRILISGDLLSKKTWNQIDTVAKFANFSGFDLITCRPEGGIALIPDIPQVMRYFYQRACNLLNHGGILLAQLPGSLSRASESDRSLIENTLALQGMMIVFKPVDLSGNSIAAIKATKCS
jgi:hypothetical protein